MRLNITPGTGPQVVLFGRAAMGKTLPHDADTHVCFTVLNRVVREIEDREAAAAAPAPPTAYHLIVDRARLLAAHPGAPALRDLLDTVRRRGPAVDVHLRPPT